VFLAFQTRKVAIKALNDSKYVAMIIYLSTVIVTMMIVFTVTLDEFLNADGAVFGGLIYIFTTIILTILFIPKVGSIDLLYKPCGSSLGRPMGGCTCTVCF
jgi:gamma-aminobutyric acid type B receptor